jgi:hypothetical protein
LPICIACGVFRVFTGFVYRWPDDSELILQGSGRTSLVSSGRGDVGSLSRFSFPRMVRRPKDPQSRL